MKIVQDNQNELLNRREVKVVVDSSSNPSMDESRKIIADEFKVAEEGVLIKRIMGKFGRKTFLITANIYKSKEDKEKAEPKSKKELAEQKAAESKEGKTENPEENKEEIKQE